MSITLESDRDDPVKLDKLSHLIANSLRTQIITGELKPDSRLPSESELIEVYKVSRPTLREAMRILEAEGLLVVGRGTRSGAIVRAPGFERAAQYAAMVLSVSGTTMGEIYETRLMVEPSLVRSLTVEKNKTALRQLRDAVEEEMAALACHDIELALRAINRFHATLAGRSDNPVMNLVIRMLNALSRTAAAFLVDGSGADRAELTRNVELTVAGHKKLVSLIESGNGDAAQAFWLRYMQRASSYLSATGLGARPLRFGSVGE